MTRVVGVLQARVGSRRLPGKVLAEVVGRPLLALQLERLGRCRRLEALVVATSDHPDDDALEDLAARAGVACHRGSLDDVLDRVLRAAEAQRADHVVRLTGDCPLADPTLVDLVVERHLTAGNDYTSNALERTYPDGLDAEAVTLDVLRIAWAEAELASEREHVTPFVWARPDRFRLGSVRGAVDLSAHRWTVDEPRDLEFVRRVYEALYPTDRAFGTADVLALLERRPELCGWNAGIETNEGYARSLAAERGEEA